MREKSYRVGENPNSRQKRWRTSHTFSVRHRIETDVFLRRESRLPQPTAICKPTNKPPSRCYSLIKETTLHSNFRPPQKTTLDRMKPSDPGEPDPSTAVSKLYSAGLGNVEEEGAGSCKKRQTRTTAISMRVLMQKEETTACLTLD